MNDFDDKSKWIVSFIAFESVISFRLELGTDSLRDRAVDRMKCPLIARQSENLIRHRISLILGIFLTHISHDTREKRATDDA